MLFAPSLLGLFGFVAHSPLHDSMWLFGLCITLLVGSFVPFIFFWASLTCLLSLGFLGPFAFLGLPWPFFLTLRSHGLLLTPLGFPGPITLSFIFGAHGLAINPLLSLLHYFGLVVAYSHFSTSHTAHGFATSLSPGSFRHICFLKAYLYMLWAYDPLFLPLGLNGFSIYLLNLFCLCC